LYQRYYYDTNLVDWVPAFTSLKHKEIVKEKDGVYFLTKPGNDYAEKLIRADFSNLYYLQCEHSKAYKEFCERVHGSYLGQNNLADDEQIAKLLEVLDLTPRNNVLELGCGIGRITEYISDTTHATITGIDFASKALDKARERTKNKKDRIQFLKVDLDDLQFEADSFDTIIEIDNLSFVKNLEHTIERMIKIIQPGGQMGILRSQIVPSEAAKEALKPDKTTLADEFKKHGLPFKTWDFTENVKRISQKKIEVAEELKEQFLEEGNLDIFNKIISKMEMRMKFVTSGLESRYLYHVKV